MQRILHLAWILILAHPVCGQFDDFDDGDAEGWTLSDVLAEVGGAPATIDFPDGNRIHLTSPASPDAEALGTSRVGFFRADVIYSDVTVLMDIVAWNPELEQDIGIIARGNTIGLGTTGGYALTIDVDEQNAYLSRLDNEAATTLISAPMEMEVGKSYRFRLTAIGNKISAGIAPVTAPDVEFVILESEDDGYAQGANGFFNNSGVADGTTDGTFDRFVAFDPSVPFVPAQIDHFSRTSDSVSVNYSVPVQAGGAYVLQASIDLLDWEILADGSVPLGFTQGKFEATDAVDAPARFYRVREAPPLFEENFEKGAEGWTTAILAGDTAWELGTPAAPELTMAHSGTHAYGTFLDRPYTNGASTTLRSPLIDLTDKVRATFSFYYYVDVTEGLEGAQVNYLDEAGEVLASIDEIFWTKTATWTRYGELLPDNVLDQRIYIEWRFLSDQEEPNLSGFFLDDVTVE